MSELPMIQSLLDAEAAKWKTALQDTIKGMRVDRTAAVLAEREANLKIARDLGDSDLNDAVLHNNPPLYCAGYERACRDIADAINLYARPAP